MKLTGFEGKTAFVTGAAGGIGRALIQSLTAAGAKVHAADTAEAIAALRPVDDDRTVWHALDVRDVGAVDRAVDAAAPTLGVHAAGIVSVQSLLATTTEEWQRVMDINAGGTFNVIRAFGRQMVAQGRGAIAVVSSNAAGIPRMNMGAYAASKAAATMLTRCLGLELAAQGVRCNIVAPGSTMTPMQTGMWADESGAARVIAGDPAAFRAGIPLGKLASAQDVADAAMFLLSDQAAHVTMADIYVDGGATLRA